MLISGKPPFGGVTDDDIMKKVVKGKYSFKGPVWKAASKESMDFIKMLLKSKSSERLSAEKALQHPWLLKAKDGDEETVNILPTTVVESLTRFQSFVKLKRTALQFIAYQLNQEDLKQMRSAFRAIDTDNSGKISLNEVLVFCDIYSCAR